MNSEERKAAVAAIADYAPGPCECEGNQETIEQIFAENVLRIEILRDLLPGGVFAKLQKTIRNAEPLDPAIADSVAEAMKQWALSKGVSHYTHWFQPLTGSTAEKHDSFIEPDGAGGVVMKFSGRNLIVGEPDASSLPSGGLRSTFEARGYTAWDPTSPAFIKQHANGATLCIPTAFCSYTGEALDQKTPLLRSMQALTRQLRRVLRCFGVANGEKIEVTLGAEQEYFLIDRHLYLCRPDLIQTGRTLFGAPPPKHQQLDDHYFASIKPRVLAFMSDVDQELWRYGIPAKTRHNEVAPLQFEIAPVFEELNLASDHNMLTMEVLRQAAERHNFVCLLHEKPFAGVSGSGKHNNWSISVGRMNLLQPGRDASQNALFLTTLCAILMAVDRHGDLLSAVTAGLGNDYRLGAQEAPPAIISIFLGDELTRLIGELETGEGNPAKRTQRLKIGADVLPTLPRDTTDRNRTSPFAYAGGKFEFRSPGSTSSCAAPNMVLNTIVAEAFDEIATRLEAAKPEEFNAELQKLLREIVCAHKRIIFNGDNYTAEWEKEAEARGLPHARTTPEALRALIRPENIALFDHYGVLSPVELESRHEVFLAEYELRLTIEAELSVSLARTMIFPAAHRQMAELAREIEALNGVGLSAEAASEARLAAEPIGRLLHAAGNAARALQDALNRKDFACMAAQMAHLRRDVDELEKLVADDLWPLPKYREMLFIY